MPKLGLLDGPLERYNVTIIAVAKVIDGSGHIWGYFHSMGQAKKAKEDLEKLYPDKSFFAEGG